MFLFPSGEPLQRVKATTLWYDANKVPCLSVCARVCACEKQICSPVWFSIFVIGVFKELQCMFLFFRNNPDGPVHFICRMYVLKPTHMHFSTLPPLNPPALALQRTFSLYSLLLGHFLLSNPFRSAELVEQKTRQKPTWPWLFGFSVTLYIVSEITEYVRRRRGVSVLLIVSL